MDEIEVATSEACTNVLKHVDGTKDSYEVTVEVNEDKCEISVIDTGYGFDHATLDDLGLIGGYERRGGPRHLLDAGNGRSIQFTSEPETGTIVHLIKRLDLTEDSVLRKLALPTS